jgi:hypothetical protein
LIDRVFFASSEKDVDEGIYEVFTSPSDHTVIAYAVWAYADNGDAGRGMLRGFDLAGHAIAQDDQSWGED